MREITLKIPDSKFAFFMELTNQLGLEVLIEDDIEVSEAHKKAVKARIKKAADNPDRLLVWDDVKDSFKIE